MPCPPMPGQLRAGRLQPPPGREAPARSRRSSARLSPRRPVRLRTFPAVGWCAAKATTRPDKRAASPPAAARGSPKDRAGACGRVRGDHGFQHVGRHFRDPSRRQQTIGRQSPTSIASRMRLDRKMPGDAESPRREPTDRHARQVPPRRAIARGLDAHAQHTHQEPPAERDTPASQAITA